MDTSGLHAMPDDQFHRPDSWPTGRLLSTAARLVEHAWTSALEELGVTHAGLIALHLLESGPANQTDLASNARVENQTMSRTLDRLERDGYIMRAVDPTDGRRHVVQATDAGLAAWDAARSLEKEIFPEIAEPAALRSALLEVISAAEMSRWHPKSSGGYERE